MHLRVHPRRRAVVLIAVLVVIVLLSLAAYKYNDLMAAEYRATDSAFRAASARAAAVSGVHYTAGVLAGNLDDSLGGNPWDNAGVFKGVSVGGAGVRFSVVALASPDDAAGGGPAYRFGLADEAARINVNALLALDKGKGDVGKKILMALPNMTDDVANAILDWIDPNDPKRSNGAKDEYYTSQSPPYHCKNGPLDSLEEMLLIKGVTPDLLFGNDRNRNGTAAPASGDASASAAQAGSGGVDLGWSAYLTVYSREANFDATGKPRIYLNDSTLDTVATALTTAVGDDLANFIVAARLYGVTAAAPTAAAAPAKASTTDTSAIQTQIQADRAAGTKKLQKVNSLWDLVNATVNVTVGTAPAQRVLSYPSPLNDESKRSDLLAKLFDTCTTTDSLDLAPRLNVNTAAPTVLRALTDAFNMQDADVQKIIDTRPAPGDQTTSTAFKSPGWLLTEAKLDMKIIKALDPFITTRAQVYRFQSVGYNARGGPAARIEAVIDANQGRPRIVYHRDLSELGKGFDVTGE